MKKLLFTVIAVLACLPAKMKACFGEPDWYSNECFQLVTPLNADHDAYCTSMLQETVNFWYGYLNQRVSKESINDFFLKAYLGGLEQNAYAKDPFYMVVSKDVAAMKYLKACLTLQAGTEERWDYEPVGDCVAKADGLVGQFGSMPAAFEYRIVLLKMRIAMQQKQYDKIVQLWKSKGQQCPDEALRRRLLGYMAGAMYGKGDYRDALTIYAELGDECSVDNCIRNYIGYDGIVTLTDSRISGDQAYLYALQDYAAYYQMMYDGGKTCDEGYRAEPSDIMLAVKADATRLKAFCKTQNGDDKIVWLSMLAWMELMEQNTVEAVKYAELAVKAKGTQTQQDNAYRILSLARLRNAPVMSDDKTMKTFAKDFKTMYDAALQELNRYHQVNYEDQYRHFVAKTCPTYCFLMTIYVDELDAYLKIHQSPQSRVVAAKMLNMLESNQYESDNEHNNNWYTSSFRLLNDSLSTAAVIGFRNAVKARKSDEAFANQLIKNITVSDQYLVDIIGTKYMREEQYDLAKGYLEQLTLDFIGTMNVRLYLEKRKLVTNRPFDRTQFGDCEVYGEEKHAAANYKLNFCKEMLTRIKKASKLQGNERAKILCEIAQMMFQSSNQGDCWALTNYGQSSYSVPDQLVYSSRHMLEDALKLATDEKTRFDIYLGLALVPSVEGVFYNLDYDWDTQEYYYVFFFDRPQREAYDFLARRRNMTVETSKCDVLKCYARQNSIP